MKVAVNIKSEVDIPIEEIIRQILSKDADSKWKLVNQLINGLALNKEGLSIDQIKKIQDFLQSAIIHFNVDFHLSYLCSGLYIDEIKSVEIDKNLEVEIIEITINSNGRIYTANIRVDDIDNLLIRGLGYNMLIHPYDNYTLNLLDVLKSKDVNEKIVDYTKKWVASRNSRLNKETL